MESRRAEKSGPRTILGPARMVLPVVDWTRPSTLSLELRGNNLCINGKKTKEMVVDFRRDKRPPPPLYIGIVAVEVVSSFSYLGVYITEDLTWRTNTTFSFLKLLDCWALAMLCRHSLSPSKHAHARTHIHTYTLICTTNILSTLSAILLIIIGVILWITSFGLLPLAFKPGPES